MGSTLDGKRILIVDDEPDVLDAVEDRIKRACTSCIIEKATTYEKADGMLKSTEYDVVVLDIMGASGFDLLGTVASRKFPVALLTTPVSKCVRGSSKLRRTRGLS